MSEDDLIRRGDALEICTDYGFSRADECRDAIAALPAAPTFTAADLERAWEMGRDMSAKACDWGDIYGDNAVSVIRSLTPPADLAQRVKKGPAHDRD